jgi:hypothetical protein
MASKAMAQLNSSKFQLSVQKVTQLQKMPLLPGLNEPGNRISITAATAPAHEGRGDHAQDQHFACHLSAP